MLSRNSTLKRGGSLKSTARLKNTTNLRSTSNFRTGDGLKATSTLRRGDSKLTGKSRKSSTGGATKNPMRHQAVIDECRRPTCEICGKPCCGEPHHIISRGAGGADIPENLIQLCGNCHRDVHSGRLDEDRLLWAVAHRYIVNRTAENARKCFFDKILIGFCRFYDVLVHMRKGNACVVFAFKHVSSRNYASVSGRTSEGYS